VPLVPLCSCAPCNPAPLLSVAGPRKPQAGVGPSRNYTPLVDGPPRVVCTSVRRRGEVVAPVPCRQISGQFRDVIAAGYWVEVVRSQCRRGLKALSCCHRRLSSVVASADKFEACYTAAFRECHHRHPAAETQQRFPCGHAPQTVVVPARVFAVDDGDRSHNH